MFLWKEQWLGKKELWLKGIWFHTSCYIAKHMHSHTYRVQL